MIDPQVVAFAGIAALLTITPGADTMLVIRTVMARGQRAGLFATMGICSGLFFHATLSALGLSLILVRSATAFEVVKIIGAGYLVWLGVRSMKQARRTRHSEMEEVTKTAAQPSPAKRRQSFVEGLLSNLLNPKVAAFCLAFLPQFISPGDWVLGKSILLASIHWAEGLVWLSIVTLFLSRLRWWIGRPRVKQAIETTTGAILVMFGLRLALARR